jgi:hypothetical protein
VVEQAGFAGHLGDSARGHRSLFAGAVISQVDHG